MTAINIVFGWNPTKARTKKDSTLVYSSPFTMRATVWNWTPFHFILNILFLSASVRSTIFWSFKLWRLSRCGLWMYHLLLTQQETAFGSRCLRKHLDIDDDIFHFYAVYVVIKRRIAVSSSCIRLGLSRWLVVYFIHTRIENSPIRPFAGRYMCCTYCYRVVRQCARSLLP